MSKEVDLKFTELTKYIKQEMANNWEYIKQKMYNFHREHHRGSLVELKEYIKQETANLQREHYKGKPVFKPEELSEYVTPTCGSGELSVKNGSSFYIKTNGPTRDIVGYQAVLDFDEINANPCELGLVGYCIDTVVLS